MKDLMGSAVACEECIRVQRTALSGMVHFLLPSLLYLVLSQHIMYDLSLSLLFSTYDKSRFEDFLPLV